MTELLSNPIIAVIAVILGGFLLLAGGEWLVRGATKIAYGLRISPLVVGLTIVALCTSAPELAVSLSAVLRSTSESASNVADVAVGNVVGSNICNILLILGVCALIRPLSASETVVKRDFPIYVVIALVMLLFAVLLKRSDGTHYFPQWTGIVFLVGFVGYEIMAIIHARREENAEHVKNIVETSTLDPYESGFIAPSKTPSKKELEEVPVEEPKSDADPNAPATPEKTNWALAIGLTLTGLVCLIGGSRLFVDGSVSLARALGVSELVIGLTLVALGTSLPELIVSCVATYRRQVDVALGNVIGSNICNVLLILGLTIALLPGGLALKQQSVAVDIPIMVVAGIAAAWFCFTGKKLERWEGFVLIAMQFAYASYLVLFPG